LNFEFAHGQHKDAVTNPNQFCILSKITPRKRSMVTSSLNEVSTDHLENKDWYGGSVTPSPHPYLQQASGQIFQDDVNGFSSTSDSLLCNISQKPNPKSLTEG
jgi:hypothetical protein